MFEGVIGDFNFIGSKENFIKVAFTCPIDNSCRYIVETNFYHTILTIAKDHEQVITISRFSH